MEKRVYIFHRDNGFYPIELENHAEARRNADCNPGTVKVEDASTGQVVWPITYKTTSTRRF